MKADSVDRNRVRGVYALVNVVTGERYVGATYDLRKREMQHFWKMERGKHDVKRIAELSRLFGSHSFIFLVLASGCGDIFDTESAYMKLLRPSLNTRKRRLFLPTP
jgi:hypothetical protein